MSDGSPVANASVLIGYRPSVADLVPPRSESGFLSSAQWAGGDALCAPDTLGCDVEWYGVTDACGDTVRTLCVGRECCDGGAVHWDGRNDEGARLLDGLYTVTIVTSTGTLSGNILVFSEYIDWDGVDYESPHASTDRSGFFSIPISCLGFGGTWPVDEWRVAEVSRWVDILAIHPGGVRVWADSVYVPEGGVEGIDLSFN